MRSLAPWCILLAPATLPAQATEVPPLEAALRAEVPLARLRALVRIRTEGVREAAAFAIGTEVLRLAADDPLVAVRRSALTTLAHLRDPRAGDALLARLDDPALQVTAAEALALLGDTRAFDPVRDRLLAMRETEDGWAPLARSLLALDRARAVPIVFEILVAEDTTRHTKIADTLAALEGDAEVRRRATELLDDERTGVRAAAVRILGSVGDLQSVSRLLGLVRDPDVRLEAVRALGELGHELAVDELADVLVHGDAEARCEAARALGRIAHPTAVYTLVDAAGFSGDALFHLRVLEALGRLGDPAGLPVLRRALADDRTVPPGKTESQSNAYPYGVALRDVAAWAAARVIDGHEPFPVERLAPRAYRRQGFDAAAFQRLAERIDRRIGTR